ncbi:MAG TPA: hypothetical protein VIG66_01785 [Noviherbaspirillum sp.]
MHSVPESKQAHLWRKVVWHTDPEQSPLGPYHSVEVYCCEEANGYAIWYVRKLGKDDRRGAQGVGNGDYLLQYFPKSRRDEAIERAVLIANGGSADEAIMRLDALAAAAQRV